MSGSPDLQSVQTLFWRLLTAPEGVAQGCETLRREGALDDPNLALLVRGTGKLSRVERVDVYANMYFYRLRDCLAEDFPNLASWIGAARFHNLVTDYLLAHPSKHPSLRELGRALPGFLVGHPLSGDFTRAPDLARLEWARLEVFDDTDATPLSRDALLTEGAASPDRFALALVPPVRLLRLEAGVVPLWKRLEDDGEPVPADGETTGERHGVCVWRRDFTIFHRSLPPDEERCLLALSRCPTSLARLGELLPEGQADAARPETAGRRLAALLDRWTADGLLFAPATRGLTPRSPAS